MGQKRQGWKGDFSKFIFSYSFIYDAYKCFTYLKKKKENLKIKNTLKQINQTVYQINKISRDKNFE